MNRYSQTPRSGGFSLLELLTVIALIGGISAYLFGGLRGLGTARSLASGQALVGEVLTVARLKSAIAGRKARVLVHVDPTQPERYLRYIVLQLARQPGSSPTDWDVAEVLQLPRGVYVVPAALTGLVQDLNEWQRPSDSATLLNSDLFLNQAISVAIADDAGAHAYTGVAFTPNGTLAALSGGPPPKGTVIIAEGNKRPVDPDHPGLPVVLVDPKAVRGLLLSAYGVPARLNSRDAF